MVKIKRDKNNLRRTCQRMAVYLFMQVSNTNGIHLCTGGQNKSKKFFRPISCLLPGVSVSPDLLCCFIFTLSEVKNASRKLFPLHLSRDQQISALLVGVDLIQDANKSKGFIFKYQTFQSHLQWQLKGSPQTMGKRGKIVNLSIWILTIHITSSSKPKQDEYLNCLQTQMMLNRASASPFIMQGAQEGRIY